MDWLMRRRVERQAIRMHEMLDRLDVDPVTLVRLRNGDAYTGARSLCLFCGSSDECLRWLDGCRRKEKSPDFLSQLARFRSLQEKRVTSLCDLAEQLAPDRSQ